MPVKVGMKSRDVGKRHLWHHADRRLELCRPPSLELEHLDVRVLDGVEGLLLECLAHDVWDHRLDHFLAHDGRSQPRLHQGARRAAGAEALDLGA